MEAQQISGKSQISKSGMPAARFISINELNSYARRRLDAAASVRVAQSRFDDAFAQPVKWHFREKRRKETKKTYEAQVAEARKQLEEAKKGERRLVNGLARQANANSAAYSAYLGEKGIAGKRGGLTEFSDPVAKELSNRVSVDAACIGFVESKADFFADVVATLQKRKDSLERHYSRLVSIVNWTDRLKDKKLWAWLKPLSTTKLGALAGGTLAAVLENLTKITEPILDKAEQFVRIFPKSQEGKDLASSLVKPLFYIGSTIGFAFLGFLNDMNKERTVRKLESTKVRKQENIDRLRVAIEGLTHMRIMLQLCDIKLGHAHFEDVKRYNRQFVDMYEQGKKDYAWEQYYSAQTRENWQKTQELLGKSDPSFFQAIRSRVSELLNGTVIWPDLWWANRFADYASLKAGQAIRRVLPRKEDK